MSGALKAIAGIFTAIVALVVIGIVVAIWWSDHSAKSLAVKEQAVAGNSVVAAGQAQQSAAAQQIVVSGQARDRIDLEVHQSNDQAIAAAPGAGAPIDPRLNDVGRRGLCRHPSFAADPECARLLAGDTGVISQAGSGDTAPAN